PEPLDEPLGDLERTAVDPDVLAEQEHALVALHLLPQRLGHRDQIGGLALVGALAAGLGAVAGRAALGLILLGLPRAGVLLPRAVREALRARSLLRRRPWRGLRCVRPDPRAVVLRLLGGGPGRRYVAVVG